MGCLTVTFGRSVSGSSPTPMEHGFVDFFAQNYQLYYPLLIAATQKPREKRGKTGNRSVKKQTQHEKVHPKGGTSILVALAFVKLIAHSKR